MVSMTTDICSAVEKSMNVHRGVRGFAPGTFSGTSFGCGTASSIFSGGPVASAMERANSIIKAS